MENVKAMFMSKNGNVELTLILVEQTFMKSVEKSDCKLWIGLFSKAPDSFYSLRPKYAKRYAIMKPRLTDAEVAKLEKNGFGTKTTELRSRLLGASTGERAIFVPQPLKSTPRHIAAIAATIEVDSCKPDVGSIFASADIDLNMKETRKFVAQKIANTKGENKDFTLLKLNEQELVDRDIFGFENLGILGKWKPITVWRKLIRLRHQKDVVAVFRAYLSERMTSEMDIQSVASFQLADKETLAGPELFPVQPLKHSRTAMFGKSGKARKRKSPNSGRKVKRTRKK